MRRLLRNKQRGQITPFALFALIVFVGTVALVIDAGIFFVTQRDLQNAADAAALAAVWYAPVCGTNLTDGVVTPHPDCMASAPSAPPALPGWSCSGLQPADCVANATAQVNLGYAGALCQPIYPPPSPPRTAIVGGVTSYIMTVECDAPFWFARVFPEIPAKIHIRAFARAAIGYESPTGVSGTPIGGDYHIVSRLVT